MLIEVDETRLTNDISHIEIRKRKDKIVVVEIPKGKTTKEITINANAR